jgi:hypothetical protein
MAERVEPVIFTHTNNIPTPLFAGLKLSKPFGFTR